MPSQPVIPLADPLYRPQSPFVVFYGEASESQSAEVTGKLVLTNPESMSVRNIKLSLSGTRKVSYAAPILLGSKH